MRAAPGHVVELHDCHYTVLDGLTVEFGFNGTKDQGKTTHHITRPVSDCLRSSLPQRLAAPGKGLVLSSTVSPTL
jgi:hypothetical protein